MNIRTLTLKTPFLRIYYLVNESHDEDLKKYPDCVADDNSNYNRYNGDCNPDTAFDVTCPQSYQNGGNAKSSPYYQ